MATNEFEIVGVYDDKGIAKGFKKIEQGAEKASKKANSMSKTFQKLGGILAGAFAVGKIIEFTKNVTLTRAEFQKFAAVLTNTLGSKSKAQKSLTMIQEFAANTPFAVTELTNSFVKLANQGFIPTQKEMTKLGDLAAAMGKGFDQLSEAIIDAQTGEFERLKEFGIRASKQGDKVTFTFKGVKKQVDFTSESIQKYLVGLGDVKGVSGGMAAISKTMGGQISNAGDAIDSLLNNLGTRGEGILGATIASFTSIVKLLDDWVKTPLSETLRDEQTEMNVLAMRLSDVNLSTEDRNKLVNEINAKYPKLLDNINTESLDTDKLFNNLEKLNKAYVSKIVLQAQQESLQEQLSAKATLLIEKFEEERGLQESLVKINKDKNLGLDLTNKTLAEQVALVQKANITNNARAELYSKEDAANIQLGASLENISSLKAGIIEQDEIIKTLTTEQIDLMKLHGETASILAEDNSAQVQDKTDALFEELEAFEDEADQEVKINDLKNLKILASDRAAELKKIKLNQDTNKKKQELDQRTATAQQLSQASSAREGLAIVLKGESQEAIAGLISSIMQSMPFPLNVLLAAGAFATVDSLFKNIGGFADGGVVGGNSFSGDKIPAMINSGERVLNIPQQEFVVGSQQRLMQQMAQMNKNQEELLDFIQANQDGGEIKLTTSLVASDYVDIVDKGVQEQSFTRLTGG